MHFLFQAYLIMDNYKCQQQGGSCLSSTNAAASYYGALEATTGIDGRFDYYNVSGTGPPTTKSPNYNLIFAAAGKLK